MVEFIAVVLPVSKEFGSRSTKAIGFLILSGFLVVLQVRS